MVLGMRVCLLVLFSWSVNKRVNGSTLWLCLRWNYKEFNILNRGDYQKGLIEERERKILF